MIATGVPSRPRKPSGPPSPSSWRKATPTTTVGSTNGTSSAARTAVGRAARAGGGRTPPAGRGRRRAAVATPDDHTVNHATRCTRGRASTSSTAPGAKRPSGQEALAPPCRSPAARRGRRAPGRGPGSRSSARVSRATHALTGRRRPSTRSATARGWRRCRPATTTAGRSAGWRTRPVGRHGRGVDMTGKTYIDSASALCTSSLSIQSMSASRTGGVVGALEHAGVLDLAEAGVEQRRGRWSSPSSDGERRRGVVGHDDRAGARVAAPR